MERDGMEGNNLLHFLDTPSAHYRLYAFSTFRWSMIWFIQSLVLYSAFLLFVSMGYAISCFASLSLLKELRRIWSRKWCRWSLGCIRFVFLWKLSLNSARGYILLKFVLLNLTVLSPHFAVSIDFNVLFACTVYLLNSCHASAIRFLKLKARMLGEKLN